MRATTTPEQRRTRGIATAIVMTAVLALSILGAGTALAANPRWEVGHGTDSSVLVPQPASGASSSSVSAGEQVGFFEWLRNDDTANISQLYLTATTTPSATVAGANWLIENAAGDPVRSGSCPAATPLACSFGALNAGHTVYVVAGFNTRSNLADGATQSVRFEFNTTGTPKGKNNSHGDAKVIEDSVSITSNGDAAGDFNFSGAGLNVADNQKLTGQNRQATSVSVAGVQIGGSVGDSPTLPATPCDDDLTADFPDWFECSLLTSLPSSVEVGNGKDFRNANGGPGIKVVISFSQTPSQLNGSQPFVYHFWETLEFALDGTIITVGHAELITDTCDYDSGNIPNNEGPCLTVGNKTVTVWLLHNGRINM